MISNSSTRIFIPASYGHDIVWFPPAPPSGGPRVLRSDSHPGEAHTTGLCYLTECISWCLARCLAHSKSSSGGTSFPGALLFISDGAGLSPFAPRSRLTLMDCSRDLVCPCFLFGVATGGAGGDWSTRGACEGELHASSQSRHSCARHRTLPLQPQD